MNSDWVKTSLGELQAKGLADIQTGPFGTVLKASEYSDHGVPVISVGEIKYGHLQVSDRTPNVSEKTKKRLPQFILETGDIVFEGKAQLIEMPSFAKKRQGGFSGLMALG